MLCLYILWWVRPFLWRLALADPALRVRLGVALVLLCVAKVLGEIRPPSPFHPT